MGSGIGAALPGGSAVARPIVAVVPFGARGADGTAGIIARQLARRIVDRLEPETALELRPVFLVSVPEGSTEAGYVVIGSTPDADLAAQYGASLGCTHALAGTFRDDGARVLEVHLVDVNAKRVVRDGTLEARPGELAQLEPTLAAWMGHALGVELADRGTAPAASEEAYLALLEGMDAELSATLLATGNAPAARASRIAALDRYVAALAADPVCAPAEARLLVMAAESLGGELQEEHERALESVIEAHPRSWKIHYLLGELRRARADVPGAIVALEHAHAVQPLGDADSIRLAELYLETEARGPAQSHLRRVRKALGADAPARIRVLLAHALIRLGQTQEAADELERVVSAGETGEHAARARRLRLGLRDPGLERELEHAGRLAIEAPADALDEARSAFERVRSADPSLWEAEFGLGLVARRAGDAQAAERAFRRALELWPGQPDALHELGVSLLMGQGATEAVDLLDEASRLRPDDAGYLADAGFAQLRAGRLAEARDRLQRASTLDGSDPITRAYLAELERLEAEIGRRA